MIRELIEYNLEALVQTVTNETGNNGLLVVPDEFIATSFKEAINTRLLSMETAMVRVYRCTDDRNSYEFVFDNGNKLSIQTIDAIMTNRATKRYSTVLVESSLWEDIETRRQEFLDRLTTILAPVRPIYESGDWTVEFVTSEQAVCEAPFEDLQKEYIINTEIATADNSKAETLDSFLKEFVIVDKNFICENS